MNANTAEQSTCRRDLNEVEISAIRDYGIFSFDGSNGATMEDLKAAGAAVAAIADGFFNTAVESGLIKLR